MVFVFTFLFRTFDLDLLFLQTHLLYFKEIRVRVVKIGIDIILIRIINNHFRIFRFKDWISMIVLKQNEVFSQFILIIINDIKSFDFRLKRSMVGCLFLQATSHLFIKRISELLKQFKYQYIITLCLNIICK